MTKNRNFFKWPKLLYFLVMAAILETGRLWRTQFSKGTTQGSFQQSLVEIGRVVSEESVRAVLYPRWPPWLKIEISSNGQNCSILSQKVPKFELYKHNDELFNMYYGIFCSFDHLKKFLFLVMAAILDTGRHWRTKFSKGTTQGSFQQSFVEIGSVVSEKIFFFTGFFMNFELLPILTDYAN
jgi:hypothetical protein